MKVVDIIALASTMVGKDDFALAIKEALEANASLSDDDFTEYEKFLSCYNITASELAEEHLPLNFTEELTSTDGKYYYNDFKYPPLRIKSVYRSVNAIDYNIYSEFLYADSDKIKVTYEYQPIKVTDFNDEVCPFKNTIISERLIALGVASEYCLITGMYEAAVLLRDRFTKSLEQTLVKRKVPRIKQRTWF